MLTKDEAENLLELFEVYFFQLIRDDENIDNIEWARSMLSAYDKLKAIAEGE